MMWKIKLVSFCKEIGLDVIGLMCIPPINIDPEKIILKK